MQSYYIALISKKFKVDSIKQIEIYLGNYLITLWSNSKILQNYYFY